MEQCGTFYVRHPIEKNQDKRDMEDARNQVAENKTTHCWGISGDNLMTHFQWDVCHLRTAKVIDTMSHRLENDRLL